MEDDPIQENYYLILNTDYGEIGFVWSVHTNTIRMREILLPQGGIEMGKRILQSWSGSKLFKGKTIPDVVGKVVAYLNGDRVVFQLADLGQISLPPGFRGDVLVQTLKIPQGMIDTYGGLAKKTRHPKAARAVGTVMAQNRFPLVIPCHRVIRADGDVGCYGGGTEMKRRFLAMEGVTFDRTGRVADRHFCR